MKKISGLAHFEKTAEKAQGSIGASVTRKNLKMSIKVAQK